MLTRRTVWGNKWQQRESIGVIILRMRMRFVVRIRMWQTESVHVAIQNVSAHESDKKFQGVTSSQTCFLNFPKMAERFSGKAVVLHIED